LTAFVSGPEDVDMLSVQFTVKSGSGEFKDAMFCRFETDAPAGRYIPLPRGCVANVMSQPDLKAILDAHPGFWRVDGDVVVIQKSVQVFDKVVEAGRRNR
jgi:hypothetical protein